VASLAKVYRRAGMVPGGRRLFSLLYARKAPYFRTVRPYVAQLRPHYAQVLIRDRKAVHNHIGTVHAIAVCNGLEAAMGALAEATVPDGMRWLPKGMEVSYLAKSSSDLICTATTTPQDWADGPDVRVKVEATRTDGVVTVHGVIHLWVTPSPR
jgi:acyl-coenzyme A thioesterase PaaI-like protein